MYVGFLRGGKLLLKNSEKVKGERSHPWRLKGKKRKKQKGSAEKLRKRESDVREREEKRKGVI